MPKLPPRAPVVPPAWDPSAARYWDERDLEGEVYRTFQICHECRMCVTYCGAFPFLFDAIDREVDADRAEGAETLGAAVVEAVSDHCWQCKLCYIKCPYTRDEGARELLDFPRLMAREKAVRARRRGVSLVDRVLGEPELIGAAGGGLGAPIANLVNKNRLLRKVMETATGISSEFPLPPLAAVPFHRWFARHRPAREAGSAGAVVLFPTCYGTYNFPNVARAATLVLEKNGYEVLVPEGLRCCGMPNLDGGDVEAAKQKMAANVAALAPALSDGLEIVVPGPTCGYTMKKEWPLYVPGRDAERVAGATRDLMEFLERLRQKGRLNQDFEHGLGKVVYHAACHLRAQKIAYPGARLLGGLPDTEVRVVERCSAVDGTWGMKAAYYEEGARYASKLTRAVEQELGAHDRKDAQVVSDCSLAALRIQKENGVSVLHPIEAVAEAYGLT
jgi:glycerol-3-phosphate dehydrogenase subunit C